MTTPQLSQEILNNLAYHFIATKHAQIRLLERFGTTNRDVIKQAILHPFCSYKNNDNSYNVAINEFEYFVFKIPQDSEPIMITFKEKSNNNITIMDKFKLCVEGYYRKNDNQNTNL